MEGGKLENSVKNPRSKDEHQQQTTGTSVSILPGFLQCVGSCDSAVYSYVCNYDFTAGNQNVIIY